MSINAVVSIGVVFILILLLVLFLMPTESRAKKKKRRQSGQDKAASKNWQKAAERLEKQRVGLNKSIAALENSIKTKDKQILLEKAKGKKFQEKLSQERGWFDKEKDSIDKKGKELKESLAELSKVQDQLAKEHAAFLRLDKELKELRQTVDQIQDQRRKAQAEAARLKSEAEVKDKENKELARENRELAKKKDETQWIAKAEFDRVVRELKESEKQLAVIKKEIR